MLKEYRGSYGLEGNYDNMINFWASLDSTKQSRMGLHLEKEWVEYLFKEHYEQIAKMFEGEIKKQ